MAESCYACWLSLMLSVTQKVLKLIVAVLNVVMLNVLAPPWTLLRQLLSKLLTLKSALWATFMMGIFKDFNKKIFNRICKKTKNSRNFSSNHVYKVLKILYEFLTISLTTGVLSRRKYFGFRLSSCS